MPRNEDPQTRQAPEPRSGPAPTSASASPGRPGPARHRPEPRSDPAPTSASPGHPGPARPGRSRDESIDGRILAAAKRQLSVLGYEGMSIASVALEAGTTRQALYRRWRGKAELARDAVAELDDSTSQPAAGDPFSALVAELTDFQRGVSRPGRLSLVGTMLQETTEPEVLRRYRGKIIQPRRRRITAILEEARASELIDPDADLEIAVALCTGNWYGRALAGDPPPANWPVRTAALVWRALGGRVPERHDTGR